MHGFKGIAASALVGAASSILWFFTVFFTVSLFNPENLLPGFWITLFVGAIVGPAFAFVRYFRPGKPLYLAGTGLGAGVIIWLLQAASGVAVPPVFVVAALVSGAITGVYSGWCLEGTNPRKVRRDNIELMITRALKGLLLSAFTIMVLFPFLYMVSMSLRSRAEFLAAPTNLSVNFFQPPAQLLRGYIEVLTEFNFAIYIVNSTLVALLTVVVTLTTAILGAYAVTRLKFPGRKLLSKTILLIYMFPAIVLVIPLYSVFTQLGLRNTRSGLLIVYAAMTIPVALYMLRSYFQTLPADLEEAGMIDGCSRGGVIWRITIPLSGPAIASVALYVFMIAWNEFLFAFMFLDSPEIFTLSRGMVVLDDMEVPRQYLMAGATIITVPIMIMFFRFQKYLVGGLTAGGVKG
ncbi:MAG: carbohydrate ABC transporter permease [Spirochaetaceae bacterium]